MRLLLGCLMIGAVLAIAAAPVRLMAAENLIRNGDLEGVNQDEYNYRPLRDAKDKKIEDSKWSIFAEDNGNHCFRIDILRYVTDSDGKKTVNACVAVGGSKGYDFHDGRKAFEVEPDTQYRFSFRLRGTVKGAYVHPIFYHNDGLGYDNMDNKVRAEGIKNPLPVGGEWQDYSGTFTTSGDTTRAVLRIGVYTHERYGLTEEPGTYLLIDDIKIEKADGSDAGAGVQPKSKSKPKQAAKPAGLGAGAPMILAASEERAPGVVRQRVEVPVTYAAPQIDATPAIDGALSDAAWSSAEDAAGFRKLQADRPAQTSTKFKTFAGKNALYIAISCEEPRMSDIRVNVDKDGGRVWEDDCVEVFMVDPDVMAGPLMHFMVNPKGIRFMAIGERVFEGPEMDREQWQVGVKQQSLGWTVEMKLSYAMLGLNGPLKDGKQLLFNVCRERYAGETELSSWSYSAGNFHNQERFGVLLIGDPGAAVQERLAQVQKLNEQVRGALRHPAEDVQAAMGGIDNDLQTLTAADAGQWRDTLAALEAIDQQLNLLRWNDQSLHVFAVSTTADFSIPFLPDPPKADQAPGVHARGAINEYVAVPVAIINSSNRTESYRVVLFDALDNGIESAGLKTQAGQAFPLEQITLREGVRVKDSDNEGSPQRFDPLVEMNGGQTLTVPPGQGGLVWMTFNTRDVEPGLYKGTLRVIPLGLPAKYKLDGGWKYEGPMQDVPFELEVQPIALSRGPAMPTWLMEHAENEAFFKDMTAHGDTVFQLSPWSFPAKFDKDGGLAASAEHTKIRQVIADHERWSKAWAPAPIDYVVGFSGYQVFNKQFAREQFEVDSPAWRAAFGNWLKSVEAAFASQGVEHKRYWIEMWDEPHRPDQATVLATLRVAKQATPDMRLLITLGASMQTPEEIRAMAADADGFCVWGSYFGSRAYQDLFKELQAQGKEVWFYFCDTRLSADLYRYYRLHAWKEQAWGLDGMGLFHYVNGPGGYYGRASWKTSAFGALVYNTSGRPTPSIRYEVLRQGLDDVKYLTLLKDALAKQRQPGGDAQLADAMQALLDKLPTLVAFESAHRHEQADAARAKIVELLMRQHPAPAGGAATP